MNAVEQRIRERLAPLFAELQQERNDRESKAAEADPKAHKLSRVMAGQHGLNYHYIRAGFDGRRRRISFCWSVHRNVAGYFLAWRQVESKRQVRRDRWSARKTRVAVARLAEARANAWRQKHDA